MTVILPTPFEHLVEKDDNINEVWYRRLSELATDTNRLSSALASITSALAAITTASTVTLTFATQADQEATTAPAAIVTPSVQQYHPSATKAWGLVRVTTAGVMTLSTGYNVASATTVGGAGRVTVTLTVPFASSDYVVVPSITNQSSALSNNVVQVNTLASSQFSLIVYDSSGTNNDPAAWHFACYGDQ
jgi:hypothetical protein